MSDRNARIQGALERFRTFRHHEHPSEPTARDASSDRQRAVDATTSATRELDITDARSASVTQIGSTRPLDELRDEARYHRERYELYRAKVHGSRPTSMTRLRELERTSLAAEARLQRAGR